MVPDFAFDDTFNDDDLDGKDDDDDDDDEVDNGSIDLELAAATITFLSETRSVQENV